MDSEIRRRFSEIQRSVSWPIFLFDYLGNCIDANNMEKIGEHVDVPDIPIGEIVRTGNFKWICVGTCSGVHTYYIAMHGSGEVVDSTMKLIRMIFFEDRKEMDRTNLFRNLLFGRLEEGYDTGYIEDMQLAPADSIQCVLIDHNGAMFEDVKVICENILDDLMVVEADRHHVVLIDYSESLGRETLEAIIAEISAELLVPVKAGVGKRVNEWSELSQSYRTARSTLRLGRRISGEDSAYFYNQMMVLHLTDEVSEDAKLRLLHDFGQPFRDMIEDEELLQTAMRFFENDLNITETARQLYVHRNTLIYRLNKVEKLSGLDLRSFDDAIQFYLLMLMWRLESRDLKG